MNICVYGSADVPSEKCLQAAKMLGSYIGENGHTLVYGGFGDGLQIIYHQGIEDATVLIFPADNPAS